MTDFRQDLEKAAQVVAGLAKEASYVAIGVGVLGFHKAQVRRKELASAAERARQRDGVPGSLFDGREQMLKRAKDFDATVAQVIKVVDSSLEPMFQRLPQPVQAIVQQAREARDELRAQVLGFPA
jgi:cell division GTPase FtsZ